MGIDFIGLIETHKNDKVKPLLGVSLLQWRRPFRGFIGFDADWKPSFFPSDLGSQRQNKWFALTGALGRTVQSLV